MPWREAVFIAHNRAATYNPRAAQCIVAQKPLLARVERSLLHPLVRGKQEAADASRRVRLSPRRCRVS